MSTPSPADQLRDLCKGITVDVISQGAEAIVATALAHPFVPSSGPVLVKFRPPKPYRHPTLDAQLTKHRTLAEARLLQKLQQIPGSVSVPHLVFVDPPRGLIWMEYVEGKSLKQWIWDTENDKGCAQDQLTPVLVSVGHMIGMLHQQDIVHGDLTTSNVLLRASSLDPVIIDFGLGSHSSQAEDRAVDLYVLERAVSSTHPVHSIEYNKWLLQGYEQAHGQGSNLKDTLRRLEDVRMRGRKRSMLG